MLAVVGGLWPIQPAAKLNGQFLLILLQSREEILLQQGINSILGLGRRGERLSLRRSVKMRFCSNKPVCLLDCKFDFRPVSRCQ